MADAIGLVIIFAVWGAIYCSMMILAMKRRDKRHDHIMTELDKIKSKLSKKAGKGRGKEKGARSSPITSLGSAPAKRRDG